MSGCYTSLCMSHLLIWRNPQGSEDNWPNPHSENNGLILEEPRVNNWGLFTLRVITAEIGIILLGVVAAVEAAVYVILFVPSILIYGADGVVANLDAFNASISTAS